MNKTWSSLLNKINQYVKVEGEASKKIEFNFQIHGKAIQQVSFQS